eukprot:m.785984 g.785984  ORF g.785984 m.785984 type:complete len:406 (+) comp59173_c0_seq3:2-1219(+)
MVKETRLYDLLEVKPDASQDEIKRAFRKLTVKLHPDKNPDGSTAQQFQEITAANQILSDPEKRAAYDKYGEEGMKEGAAHSHGGMPGGIFDMFFGGGRGQQRERRGKDMVHQLPVSMKDLYVGKVSKLAVQKNVICSSCSGKGGKEGAVQPCRSCSGQGVRIELRQIGPGMVQQVQRHCPDCDGEGEQIKEKDRCKACNGKKVVPERKILEVHIDKGMEDGQKIPFSGESDQQPGLPPGDIIIVLDQKEHPVFKRKGSDLLMEMELTLVEALCGFQRVVNHLDDRQVLVKTQPGQIIKDGAIKIIYGEGFPQHRNPFEKGRLFIHFKVAFPGDNFADATQLKALEALLPPRPAQPEITGDVEETELQEYDREGREFGKAAHKGRSATDEDEEGHHAGPGVQCASQ